MCDVCTDLLNLLDSHEEKIQGDGLHLSEGEIITVLIYAQAWSQRQCMCCFREVKNFERLNDIVQVILSMSIKTIETIPIEQKKFLEKENNSEKEKAEQKSNESGENEKTKSEDEQKEEKDGADDGDYIWTIDEKDKLLQFVSKLFLMNFPLYMAYKHMVHEEINPQEANALGNYCEVADTEVPLYLLRNVCFFCDTNGIQAIATCFDNGDPATLPFFVAHTLITIIANLRMWMNIPTIMQCIVPLRSHIIRYMCKLSDKDLRMAGLRNMTDLLWAAVKEPLDSQVTFDHEVLDLAFKYFTCSTLTIRLAGVSQMNNQINIYNENCNNESTNDAESIGNKIANWLIDNKLVEHIFGPNLHVEIIKQCQMILNFLAVESRIINEHIDCIWAAAQLKHCSKQVHDILMTLIKNLDIERVQHLLKLVSSLEISSHTEQTLYLAYALIKRIWMSAGGPCPHVAQQPHQSPQYSGAVKEHEEFTKGIQEGVKDSPSNKSDVDVRKRKHDDDEDDDDEAKVPEDGSSSCEKKKCLHRHEGEDWDNSSICANSDLSNISDDSLPSDISEGERCYHRLQKRKEQQEKGNQKCAVTIEVSDCESEDAEDTALTEHHHRHGCSHRHKLHHHHHKRVIVQEDDDDDLEEDEEEMDSEQEEILREMEMVHAFHAKNGKIKTCRQFQRVVPRKGRLGEAPRIVIRPVRPVKVVKLVKGTGVGEAHVSGDTMKDSSVSEDLGSEEASVSATGADRAALLLLHPKESEEGSLLEEEEDEEEGEIRKTKEEGRQGSSPTTSQEFVGSNVETEVYDCGNYLQQFQTHRHRHLQGDFMEDILSPDDGSCNSSHISNKSEKNMADFEGEDVMSDEEVAHIHGNSCVPPHMRAHAQFRSHVQQQLVNIASMYHAHGQVPHGIIHHHNNEDDEDDEEHICSSFSYEDVCKTGHTLLWDLVQEDAACHLPEGLDAEAEKALFSLVCYSTDRRIRMKFIGACIDNLANNTSVVVSLRFLPKLLGSFQQYRSGTEPYNILIWAENKLNMMKHFFNNLIHFSDSVKEGSRPPAHSLYTFRDEVQVRLQFLTGVFSSLGSPDTFRLSLEQVDTLWSCLVINPASTDECLSWFLSQAKSKDHHALGLGAFKHIFLQKMPQLQPENISMIGLNLFQQLCHLARLANNSFDNPLPEDEISGMDQLWGIALKAHNTDVSMSAIQYLNNYYIMYDKVTIGKEEEFIQRCMESLRPESSLLVIQRALILLKNHLESFRRRYAFHLRIWQLDNQGIISHQKLLQDRQSSMLRVVLQPAGLAEKQSTIEMLSSDLVAELRAEVTRWWESLQKQQKTEKQTPTTGSILTPILGSMLGDGPVRMITLGQELTVDMDEKSLLEIQFKDRQLVFISVGVSRHPRKQDGSTPASYQPAPKREQIPMMILLQEQYFEHLFNLLQELSSLHCPNPEISNNDNQESYTVESKARLLSHKVWELLMLLPTSHSMLHGFKSIMDMKDTEKSESNLRWDKLLNCHSPHKLMYSLQIVESISRPPKHKWRKRGHSGGGDYLPSSDSEDTSDSESNEESWSKKFVAVGGLWHMFHIFLSGCLQSKEGETWNEWNQECLGYLLRLISQFSISQDDLEAVSDDVFDQYDTPRKKMKKQKSNNEKILIPRLNETILSMMEVDAVMKILTTILHDAAVPSDKNQLHSSFARAEVVHYALSFLVSWAYSCEDVHPVLCSPDRLGFWLKRLTLDAPEPHVRREACMGLYRLCHGQTVDGSKKGYCFLLPLLSSLLTFLDYAKKMKPLKTADFHLEDGKDCPKEPYGAGCRDYFWLVCRLVESITKEDAVKSWEESGLVDLNSLASHMANAVVNKDYLEPRINTFEDDALIGLLQLGTSIMKHSPPFKSSVEGREFMAEIFWCLFSLPSVNKRHLPKCKSDASRSATYDLLIELVKGSYDNYVQLHQMVLAQHSKDAHSVYPWDHWPHDDGRSNCGYVGLTNLGATCYMATCMQHLYMIPQARESVLQATVTNDCGKYEGTLTELKKMFAYLLESERKAYNPRGFCKVYTMDKQPLNTGEQKDMTEFFTDLISKLEEMSPELKDVVKTLFGGVLSNNVVSLDCPHVSRTLEEFYTVRCQVADMKNLYESLDEVTVKDTLEGDNMYTCSKCQKKVRAEKRACFKSLPKILCFNTMRYTFNMVTMMKEKVNTHFSFPLRLSMEDYMEHNLIRSDKIRADDEEEDNEKKLEGVQQKDPNEESYEYELTGVTVHTGTADGGHYYSFIRDRLNQSENGQDKWFLFNDAEVKSFDPGQIAGECFGGEMTSKTYDSVTDKFMDFSFEKTNSAYMLFYERIPKNKDMEAVEPSCEEQVKKFNFELSKELADWIWQDNMQFLQDKNIFEHTYFGFMWQMCGYIPTTLPRDDGHQVPLLAAKLSASFVLETLIHAKEKPTMLQWIELLTKQFNSCPAACEWFLDHMANDDWWPQQILIKCPNQVVRQMFHRLIIHVITQLKPAHVAFYLQPLFEREDEVDRTLCNEIEKQSCVTRFIKKMLSITQHGVKPHSKYLSEYFAFFLDFAKMGSEECIFLIQINTISTFINFYMGHKGQDYVEIISDDEEEDDDVIVVTEDKFRPTSLEKMITLISILVEETRVDGREVRLSDKDLNTLVGGKGFPFLFNQIRDNVNLRQTCNLIFSICRWNDRAALTVVQMIFSAITSAKLNQEQSQPFFKVLSMLVEFIGGPPGMPNFTRYVLLKFWEVVEYCPQPCLEWLSAQVTRNKIIHSWVMQHLEHWVELYLIGHNNPRVRNAAAYLLVSLIPSPGFRQAFRSSRHLLSPLKEMNQEAVDVLHAIYEHLLRLLNRARHFVDAATHGTNKLTSYFALMTYCLLSRAEKLMFSQYFMDLWQLFQPKLTEPPISMHHNKQALLIFWHQVCVDCPENVQLIVSNAHVTKNIAFNYILADHDDQEVVIFNRCMLPAYYGILRMCCQQSRSFTRQLAHHQNIQWAFKNITPYPAQYTAAVEELFKMMKLMVLRYPDTSDEELKSINHFKRNTLLLYLQNLDARSNWQTLIPALKTLVENGDDRMLLMYNNGLLMITEAFCTLHMMFHEATACHVTGDIVELLSIFPPVIKMARLFAEKKVGEAKQCLSNWKEKMELIRKLLTLLNSYTPPEVREASLNVLREMVLTFQNDAIQVILPIVISAHVQFQNNTPFAPGPYFPRRGQKAIGGLKSNIRPPRPQFQMLLHSSLLESAKGIDKTYDNALCEFFYPYHQFVDLMCRVAVNQQNLMEQLINLSAMVAYEGVPLHSPYFAKLWYEIYHLEHVDKNCVDILCKSSSFIDYVESILLDERQSLNNQFIFQFFTNYFPRVHQQVLNDNGQALMDNIIQSITIEKLSLENTQCDDDILEITQKINGDLRALRLIFSVQPPKEMDSKLNEALSVILGICKQFQERKHKEKTAQLEVAAQTDETPAKKRKMSIDENKDDEKVEDEKETIERRLDRDSPIPGTSSQKCEIENPDSETEDDAKKGKMDLKKLIPKEKPNSVDVVAKHIESLFEMVNKQKPST